MEELMKVLETKEEHLEMIAELYADFKSGDSSKRFHALGYLQGAIYVLIQLGAVSREVGDRATLSLIDDFCGKKEAVA